MSIEVEIDRSAGTYTVIDSNGKTIDSGNLPITSDHVEKVYQDFLEQSGESKVEAFEQRMAATVISPIDRRQAAKAAEVTGDAVEEHLPDSADIKYVKKRRNS